MRNSIDARIVVGWNIAGSEVGVMTSWMEERDRLLAQTLAFVQEVAAAHPSAVLVEHMAPACAQGAERSAPPSPVAGIAGAASAAAQAVATPQPGAAGKPPLLMLSERAEITQRVAAFRARQSKINEERDAYYRAVQAKIKAELAERFSG